MRLVELNRKENHYEDYTHERRDESYTSIPDFLFTFFFISLKHVLSFNEFFICYFILFCLNSLFM